MIEKINNHREQALKRLLEQYKDKPNFIEMITIYTKQIQEIENMFFDLLEKRGIDEAEGAQLDGIGTILNQSRIGLSDDNYRGLLYSKIAEYNSEGTIEDILNIARLVIRADSYELQEYYPASFILTAVNPNPLIPEIYINNAIRKARPVCIEFNVVYTPVSNVFRFDTIGYGFDKGKFSKVI